MPAGLQVRWVVPAVLLVLVVRRVVLLWAAAGLAGSGQAVAVVPESVFELRVLQGQRLQLRVLYRVL